MYNGIQYIQQLTVYTVVYSIDIYSTYNNIKHVLLATSAINISLDCIFIQE